MPRLTTELLGQVSTGEIPDRLKFVCFEIQEWDDTVPLDQETPIETVGHVIYIAPETEEHLSIPEELEKDISSGQLPINDGRDYSRFDAGRIRREKSGAVVFYDHSSGMELGDDPVKREVTGRFVQREIAGPNVKVLWQMQFKPL